MWTYPELEVTLPRLLPADPTWKATASHNAERAPSGLTLAAWTTGVPQAPDMWFQVEVGADDHGSAVRCRSARGRPRPRRGSSPGRAVGSAGAAGGPGARYRRWSDRHTARLPVVVRRHRRRRRRRRRPRRPIFGSYPIGYQVQLSMDRKTGGAPSRRAQAHRRRPTPRSALQAKFIRVTQTGTAEARGRCSTAFAAGEWEDERRA
jgi:hypothetical protein